MIKNPKILLWLFFIVISLLLIAPNPNAKGMVVTSSELPDIEKGTIIYQVDNTPITDVIGKNFSGITELKTDQGSRFVRINGTLPLTLKEVPATNLNLGLDIEGGVRAIIKPLGNVSNSTIDQVIGVLRTRINIYGLEEVSFRPLKYQDKNFIEIQMAGGTEKDLKTLLEKQGKFEATINLILKNNLTLENEYPISISNNTLTIDNNNYQPGDVFKLEGIKFQVNSVTEKTNLTTPVFTGKDITMVFFDPQHSFIEPKGEGYRWMFNVQITKGAAQNFKKITQNLERVCGLQRDCHLSSNLDMYVDSKLMDSLSIAAELKGKEITTPAITGYGQSKELAVKNRKELQSLLQSGSLPVAIDIVKLEKISPKLGQGFLISAAKAGAAALLIVALLVFIRYRKLKYAIPVMIFSFSEVCIILGMSVVIGWTIDLAAIAGIIAAVGTGVDSQIMILDEAIGFKEELSFKEKLKRAFFMIFGAGGTTIAAMFPLTLVGFGSLRGFALTTMLGVLIGIFITRQAFGEIVKKMEE